LSRGGKFGVALPWGLLCADDVVVVAGTENDLGERLSGWRDFVENGGVAVDVGETKVVISGERWRVMQRAVGWLCGVCGGGVDGGSMQCAGCRRWGHGRCGGVEEVACAVMKTFVCGSCMGPVAGVGCGVWMLVSVRIWNWWMGFVWASCWV